MIAAWKALWQRAPAPLLGIDISSTTIKLVELGRAASGQYVLERCAIEPLERGWVTEGNIDKFDEVAEALRQVVRKSGSKTRQVALALPGSAVITKKILLPMGLTERELEFQVEAEAGQYIPFPLDEVSLDFCVGGPSAHSADLVEVLLAASRKEKVADRQGLAEAAGLKPVIMDVESYASRMAAMRLVAHLPNQGRDLLIALLEIGSQTTSLQVVRNGEVIYERDQMFGGAQLTHQIARHYNLPFEEADQRKKNADLPEDYARVVLPPFLEGLAQEVGRALQFFFTSTPHNKVEHILLSGGSAALPGLAAMVQLQTQFQCQIVQPFEGMLLGPAVKGAPLQRDATSYLVATGLAMRRFVS